jgi:hypothetical protein
VGADGSVPDDAVTLTADSPPQLLVSTRAGVEKLTLTKFRATGPALQDSNFWVEAPSLKGTPCVCARLELSVGGKRMVGCFDPWVAP